MTTIDTIQELARELEDLGLNKAETNILLAEFTTREELGLMTAALVREAYADSSIPRPRMGIIAKVLARFAPEKPLADPLPVVSTRADTPLSYEDLSKMLEGVLQEKPSTKPERFPEAQGLSTNLLDLFSHMFSGPSAYKELLMRVSDTLGLPKTKLLSSIAWDTSEASLNHQVVRLLKAQGILSHPDFYQDLALLRPLYYQTIKRIAAIHGVSLDNLDKAKAEAKRFRRY